MENNCYNEKQWTFEDSEKTIDFVLVWDEFSRKTMSTDAVEQRMIFEENLREEGLELENEFTRSTGLHFIKIHAPLEILKCYAEILKLRMPIKNIYKTKLKVSSSEISAKSSKTFFTPMSKWFEIEPHVFPDFSEELTATYTRARDYLFDWKNPGFFTPAQKARIVQFILERTLYTKTENGEIDAFEFGINRLVMHGVYVAAYPLHDGDWQTPGSLRYKFYRYWASYRNWYKKQPADQIMQYFGVKIGLYFIWLGHYTNMLLSASFVGVLCFIISVLLIPSSKTADEVCEDQIPGVMCPLCDFTCDFWHAKDFCFESRLLIVFDNSTTVLFAIFISFWAAVYLEFWRRYSAEITLRWDLTSLDDMDENPRPEYAARLSQLAAGGKVTQQLNFITNVKEPKVSFWHDLFLGKVLSLTTMLLMVTMAIAAVIGITMYDMFALTAMPTGWISSTISTMLNLFCIPLFSPIYERLSAFLTELEMHRTQPEFDNALILKMYLLEFINNYASIFYIAFFKGIFIGPPSGYYRIFGYRQLECTAGSCMLELTEQLAVIMIGRRILSSLIKVFTPMTRHEWKKHFSMAGHKVDRQWEKDFLLQEDGSQTLFPDKLDMVLQYGFVTIFVSAFPLAPLFALINNIFEIRIDAQKLLIYHRRPALRRAKDIGMWFNILNYISALSVFTNGFIVAFTSNFIPRMVYRLTQSPDYGTEGFLNYSLSYMAIEDLDMLGKPNTTAQYCRYLSYRNPPWHKHKYETRRMFWIVLAARLAFFIVFENMIMMAVVLVKWLIPDVPRNVKYQMRRRHYLINEMIISYESAQKYYDSLEVVDDDLVSEDADIGVLSSSDSDDEEKEEGIEEDLMDLDSSE